MDRINYLCIKVILLSVLSFLTSCAVQSAYKKVSTTNSEEESVFVDSSMVILVFPPKIKQESIYNEKEVDSRVNTEIIKTYIENCVLTLLKNKGFHLEKINQLPGESRSFQDELRRIQDNSESIFKAYVDSTLQETVKQFGEKSKAPSILIIHCDVKIGSGGSWNSYSGAITTQNNRTILKAVLIRTSDCTKLWYNSTQLRELPKVEDPSFEKAVNSVFINLKPK